MTQMQIFHVFFELLQVLVKFKALRTFRRTPFTPTKHMPDPAIPGCELEQANTLLVIEDDRATSEIVTLQLRQHGFNPIPCYSAAEAIQCLRESQQISAALIDLSLPDGYGIDVLREARQLHPNLPCYILTAKETVNSIVVAMKAGADDYIVKPFDPLQIVNKLKSEMAVYSGSPQARLLSSAPPSKVDGWKSPKMREALKLAVRAGKTVTPVFITGQPNTGRKSLVRIIDNGRKCSAKPLITIDAAIMPPLQLEVELFGRPLSTPSDEISLSRGKLERGQGSNLHIANIERLTPLQQANLHLWMMTGDDSMRHGKNSRCRLIASSTPAISDAIQRGQFRKDLWYALSVCHIEVPSLVERTEDLPQLCEKIMTNICVNRKLPRPTLTRQALEMIVDHSWPGNLSELENVLEYAIIHTNDRLIGPKELPHLQNPSLHDFLNKGAFVNPLGSTSIDEITRASLLAALEACGGNRRRAAQRLKVSLRTVYNMIQRYEIPAQRKGGSANEPKG